MGLISVTAFAVANMIGTGVFTSLGFQLVHTHTPFAILALWVIGGLIALCGSLSYGELGASMPRSGGEYHYLSRIYHPFVGFLSGFVSMTVGFAAPIALACMALGRYTQGLFPMVVTETMIAVWALIGITAVHLWSVQVGSRFQNLFTLFKIVLIVTFVIGGLAFAPEGVPPISVMPSAKSWHEIIDPAFAVSLIYVSYSYSGWNASAYVANEVKNPQRTLPRSLFLGVLVVMILYVLLNYTFMQTASMEQLSGQLEVGNIAATNLLGSSGGKVMSILIGILLISSISSMVFVGPRVTQVMGEDLTLFRYFAAKNRNGVPVRAIILQFVISLLFLLTGSFEAIVTYSGFVLSLFTFLTVTGVFIHRHKYPSASRPYKTWGYPVVPILFLALTGWTMIFLMKEKTGEALMGLLTLAIGALFYWTNRKMKSKSNSL